MIKLTIQTINPPQNIAEKESNEIPYEISDAIKNVKMLITNVNKPSVIILTGNVSIVSTGLMTAFIVLKITAKIKPSISLFILNPGMRCAIKNITNRLMINLMRNSMAYSISPNVFSNNLKSGREVISLTSSEYITLSDSSNTITLLASNPSRGPDAILTP